jgi:hypothetical protein
MAHLLGRFFRISPSPIAFDLEVYMLSQNTLPVLLLIAVVVLVVLIALMFFARRRIAFDSQEPTSMTDVSDARHDPGEFKASLIGEQIEEMVRERLAKDPALSGVSLDFATAVDGSLEIWVDGDRYTSVEDIPDEGIRKAVAESVDEFNR